MPDATPSRRFRSRRPPPLPCLRSVHRLSFARATDVTSVGWPSRRALGRIDPPCSCRRRPTALLQRLVSDFEGQAHLHRVLPQLREARDELDGRLAAALTLSGSHETRAWLHQFQFRLRSLDLDDLAAWERLRSARNQKVAGLDAQDPEGAAEARQHENQEALALGSPDGDPLLDVVIIICSQRLSDGHAGEAGGDRVGGVPVKVGAAHVVPQGGPGVAVPHGVLHVAERDAGDQAGGAARPAEAVEADRVLQPGDAGQSAQPAGVGGGGYPCPGALSRIGPAFRSQVASWTARRTGTGSGIWAGLRLLPMIVGSS